MPFERPVGPTRRAAAGGSGDSSGDDRSSGRHPEDIEILEIEAVDDTGQPLEQEHQELPQEEMAAGVEPAPVTGAAAEFEELRERHIRLLAEFENYRKRRDREAMESRDAGAEALLTELLPTIDNLDRALSSLPPETPRSVAEGLTLIRKHLLEAMSGQGIEVVGAVGETFDPRFHEAVAVEDGADDGGAGHRVVGTIQKGYVFRGRLVRPALVKVSVSRDGDGGPGGNGGER